MAAAAALASSSAPAMPALEGTSLAYIDPVLSARVAAGGPTPAILRWDQSTDRAELSRYLAESGVEAQMLSGFSVAFACVGTADELAGLAAAPGALSVYGDRALKPALDESVETAFDGDPTALWEGRGITGKGVSIGVIDTGVDATHPDLRSRVRLNVRALYGHKDTFGPNTEPPGCPPDRYTSQVQDSETTSGHGTHITGVAAGDGTVSGGRYTGVAPGAEIIAVGIADTVSPTFRYDDYTQISMLNAFAGLAYILYTGLEGCRPSPDPAAGGAWCDTFVATKPAKVVLAGWTIEGLHDPWHPMVGMIEELAWYGINVVFPVGNEGSSASDCSAPETCYVNPLSVSTEGAIGVAATPKDSRTVLADYSSRGDPVERTARDEPVRYEPFISAPGTGVVSARRPGVAPHVQQPGSNLGAGPHPRAPVTDRRYIAMSGTSIAAAHVAGAIALMQEAAVKANGCFLLASDVTDILRATATPMPGYESWEVGAGALNVPAAVSAASKGGAFFPHDPWMCPPA